MFFNQINFLFRDALFHVSSHISPYLVNPDKNFTRCRKLPLEMPISFLVTISALNPPIFHHVLFFQLTFFYFRI